MNNDDLLEEANQYQDFIADQLLNELGWCINLYTSRHYQYNKGESRAGVEIKYDKNMAGTKNLYIEISERHDITKKYVPSGIYRKDNTIFYLIGDYNTAYIFVKAQLKHLCDNFEKNGFEKKENGAKKAWGVLIPISYFEKHELLVVKKLNFKEE